MRTTALSILSSFALACLLPAQSPAPVVMSAATPAVTSTAPQTAPNADSAQSALKVLQEMKAANEETLRKQAAILAQLDEIEKLADQIRITTKRS
jgi:hypothetical protein